MPHFRVFLGAPPFSDLKSDTSPCPYTWKTIEPPSAEPSQALVVYPPATLEAASRRISLLYQNIIFDDTDEDMFDNDQFMKIPRFRVFLGAPSVSDLKIDTGSYTWKTIEPPSAETFQALLVADPPATLEAASRRVSLFYQNIIFDDTDEDMFDRERPDGDDGADGIQKDQTTVITWPPTAVANTTGPSFLRTSQSQSQSQPAVTYETQETISMSYSDASSIARFPHFQISLHKLSSLASLYTGNISRGRKVNVLLAILEVEGPDAVRIKKGLDAGKEVSVLKMILGDEKGSVCKLTAWRDVADAWGALGLKRGDIVYLENLTPSCEPGTSISFTASPYNNPTAEICFRSMPFTREDNRLRPDLRLAQSDVAVKKVAALVQWFERMAGLVLT